MKKKKILIADDDFAFVASLTPILKKNNYEVIVANNGEDALSKTKSCKPDLILMDVKMPRLDGDIATFKIRAQGITTPVIMLTGIREAQEQAFAAQIGAVDYIIKPFNPEDLLNKIKKALPNSER